MKTTLTRILIATLAVLMLTVSVACRKNPEKDPGYILNQSNTEAPADEITSFYNGNAGALHTLANKLVKDRTYASYNYNYRMTDYDKGTLEFYVQKQAKAGGAWTACSEEDAARLVAVKFVGTVTYDPAISKNVVIFVPRMAPAETSLSLVYCTDESGKAAVEAGKYHPGYTVTLTQIEGNWYCAEAVKNAQ